MRRLRHVLLLAACLATYLGAEGAQSPAETNPRQGSNLTNAQQLEDCLRTIDELRREKAVLQTSFQQDEEQKKKIELLQKQVETLEKMVKLLADQVKKQPAPGAGGPAVEKLQIDVATLDARSIQAAHRDQEVASAIDDLREHTDAEERYGTRLPAQLKELFLPSGTTESPLSIYGALAFGYSHILGDAGSAARGAGRPNTPGGFYFGEFTPDFLLKLDDCFFLEAEIGIGADGSVSAGSFAQADFIVNDWLTIIAGRFVAPIGWFNERLNNPCINKLPGDAPGSGPLLWEQVLPPMALLGVQAMGSFYLPCLPVKMEYAAYVSNGLNLTPVVAGAPTLSELANLQNMQDTFTLISNEKAFGGRIGLWWPEAGLAGGVSGLYSGDYIAGVPNAGGFENAIGLWAVDLSYRKGNWDVRFEYGESYQHTANFIGTNIRRWGLYGQVAYRQRDLPNGFWQKLEFVYRFGYVNFHGIDPAGLDLTTFGTPMDVPVKRTQHEFGIDYWFSPRLVLKTAYQINDEPGFQLHDNQFLMELAWGW
jgi:hypothetical protein